MNSTIPDYEPISLRGSGAFGYVIEAYDRIHDARFKWPFRIFVQILFL